MLVTLSQQVFGQLSVKFLATVGLLAERRLLSVKLVNELRTVNVCLRPLYEVMRLVVAGGVGSMVVVVVAPHRDGVAALLL